LLCYVLSQQLWLEALYHLPRAIGSSVAAGPNGVRQTPTHTWRLGCLPVCWQTKCTHEAWAPALVLDTRDARAHCLGAGHPKCTRGAWAVTRDTWHLGFALDPRFLDPRILNIIICFRNIIIFSIINIINKIINKFERKYYY